FQIQCLESNSIQNNEDEIVALKDCVERLPRHARSIVDKFYFEKLATSDIAEKEGKNSGAIRMKLFRIRKKLASCIGTKMLQSQ
ncbi:MAG: sigma factor-like helix-turn-helix DNA-binding protein, partial [Planctomycetota bacterium]